MKLFVTLLKLSPTLIIVGLLLGPLMLDTGSAQEPLAEPMEFIPGEVVIKVQEARMGRSLLNRTGLRMLQSSEDGVLLRLAVPPGTEAETIAALAAEPTVEFATYNRIVVPVLDPNDEFFQFQWSLYQETDADIDANDAWDITTGSEDIIIAMIDTGVDANHPDLKNQLVEGRNYVNPNDPPIDDSETGHGTHISGIVVAQTNNFSGVAGISWQSKVMPLKVISAEGRGDTFNTALAIRRAVLDGVDIINMSINITGSEWPCNLPDVENALEEAERAGVLVIIASGNDGKETVNCPAAVDTVLAVGSTNRQDMLAGNSNYGERLGVVAPGVGIYSTLPGDDRFEGQYGTKTGTSMAAPHVAGIAALVWSAAPSLTHKQVQHVITSTADDLGDTGRDLLYGWGRVNAFAAVQEVGAVKLGNTETLADIAFDNTDPMTLTKTVPISLNNPSPITWTASISPVVEWLEISSAVSGTIDAESPTTLELIIRRPMTYSEESAQLRVTGVNSYPTVVEVNMRYVAAKHMTHLPLIIKE